MGALLSSALPAEPLGEAGVSDDADADTGSAAFFLSSVQLVPRTRSRAVIDNVDFNSIGCLLI
jgi:hypothetical protein